MSTATSNVLRVPQVRILKALAAHGGLMTRSEIAVAAKVSLSMTGNLGPDNPARAMECDNRYGKKSLLTRGLAVPEEHPDPNGESGLVVFWKITPAGKKVARSLE